MSNSAADIQKSIDDAILMIATNKGTKTDWGYIDQEVADLSYKDGLKRPHYKYLRQAITNLVIKGKI